MMVSFQLYILIETKKELLSFNWWTRLLILSSLEINWFERKCKKNQNSEIKILQIMRYVKKYFENWPYIY